MDKSAEAKVDHLHDSLISSIVLQNTDQDKPVIVNLDAYQATFRKQAGLFSNIYNWFKPKPASLTATKALSDLSTKSVNLSKETLDSQKIDQPLQTGVNPLAISGETLVDSILDGISASTPDPVPLRPSFFAWFPGRSNRVVEVNDIKPATSPGQF